MAALATGRSAACSRKPFAAAAAAAPAASGARCRRPSRPLHPHRSPRVAAASSAGVRTRAAASDGGIDAGVPQSAQQQQQQQQQGAPPPLPFDDEPDTAKEAIDLGLVLCKRGQWQQALGVFERGLTLPGTGIKRFRDKPKLLSDGEKMALLYNIACCHSQLQDARSGLVALSGCLEAGYADFNQVRGDPDLAFLRGDPRFDGLLQRFDTKKGLFGSLFG